MKKLFAISILALTTRVFAQVPINETNYGIFLPIEKTVNLGVLSLENHNTDDSISFGTFLHNHFLPVDTQYYDGIKGISTSVISKTGSLVASYNFNNIPDITWVYTLTGDVNLKITNTYAVPLSCKVTVKTDLTALGMGVVTLGIYDFTKTPIAPNMSVTKMIKIVGLKISSKIFYEISDVSLGAKNPANIDMNDKLFIGLELANLKVNAGKAIIPPQKNPIKTDTLWFDIKTVNDKKLTSFTVSKGILNFDVTSMFPGANVHLIFPNAKTQSGDTVKLLYSFPQVGMKHNEWDMSNCTLTLDKNPLQAYNKLQAIVTYTIDIKGFQVSFDQSSTFVLRVSHNDTLTEIRTAIKVEKASNNTITLFPNPSNGRFTVDIRTDNAKNFNLELVNSLGQKVYETTTGIITEKRVDVDVSAFNSGLYLLRIVTNEGVEIRKIDITR